MCCALNGLVEMDFDQLNGGLSLLVLNLLSFACVDCVKIGQVLRTMRYF